MESDNMDTLGSGGTPVNSRWNPTKEQISILENLYKQGIRTPSAEQIQQITSRLKAYGQIEGKNVFYWFQNHKARQRQKQKQETMTSINHLCYKAQQPVYAPSSPNVVYSPCFPPRSNLFHSMVFPCSFKRRAKAEIMSETTSYAYESASSYGWDNIMMPPDSYENKSSNNKGESDQETLPLFPLHPTGRSEGIATVMTSSGSSSTEDAITAPCSLSVAGSGIDEGSGSSSKPFFDFFSGQFNFDSN